MNLAHWALTSSFLKCSYCNSSSMCRQWGYLWRKEREKNHCSPITFKPVFTMNKSTGISWLSSVCHCVCSGRNMSTNNILEVLGIFRLLPVQQVLEVVNEGFLSKDTSLGQNCIPKPEERYRKSASMINKSTLYCWQCFSDLQRFNLNETVHKGANWAIKFKIFKLLTV